MKYVVLLLWLSIPTTLWLAAKMFGTPHIVASYRFYDNGDRWNPRTPREYIDCTYVGWTGRHTVPAKDARCPWIRFFRSERG